MQIAYIPLDDRPVSVDRAIYLAGSAGVELLMPDKELYMIRLDGQPLPNITRQERIDALLHWLHNDAVHCEHIIISLDLLLSGGLAAARYIYDEDLTAEYAALDAIAELSRHKKVYVFDTVMRLASTGAYAGYGWVEYDGLRAYGSVARAALCGDSLTVDNIINGYPLDENGNVVASELPDIVIDRYHGARARQLRLNDYLLTGGGRGDYQFLYMGVDDSAPKATIQTNEMAYIQEHVGENAAILPATDELGLMCIATIIAKDSPVPVAMEYFGGGEDDVGDEFDYSTLRHSVQTHLDTMATMVAVPNHPHLSFLVLTNPTDPSAFDAHCHALLDRLQANTARGIPTAIADCVHGHRRGRLGQIMLERGIPMLTPLGFSCWNTSANAIGIALTQAMTRFVHLRKGQSCAEADEQFIKSMTFAFVKDCSYKTGGYFPVKDYIETEVGDILNFYADMQAKGITEKELESRVGEILRAGQYQCPMKDVLANLNSSPFLVDLHGNLSVHEGQISVDGFHFPMYRLFEMGIEIKV